MSDNTRGGNDTLSGLPGADTIVYGDAYAMSDDTRGGDDMLIGGTDLANNEMYGDAYAMSDDARGGNDTLGGEDARPITSTATPSPCPTTPAAAMTR